MSTNDLIFQVMRSGNPQNAMMSILKNQMGNNPMFANVFNLAQQGDTAQLENIARNICKEKGLDFDKEFMSFKQTFKL